MALNYIWIAFFIIGMAVALIKLIFFGDLDIFNKMMTGMFDSAKLGFEISIGLTGMMALWLGIMKIGENAGMIQLFSRFVRPVFKIIFKDIPKDHPANGAIAMNFSANMLGLDNAATPLGLQAMEEMQKLNPKKDTATNAMIMFLVLNTAGIVLVPTSIIAMRQTMAIEQGLKNFNAADVFLPILIVTFIGLVAGIFITGLFQRLNVFKWPIILFVVGFGGMIYALWKWLSQFPTEQMNSYIGLIGALVIMSIVIGFIVAGMVKKLNVYSLFVDGAKEGFQTAISIIPYLIAMLIAISVLRTSGCMDYLVNGIAFLLVQLGVNTDFVPALPVGLMKPLSGSGARGLMVDVFNTYGVNSFQGNVAAVLQGSTETTFYVLAVYFGSVKVKNIRYALSCGLIVDAICIITAILVAYAFYH